jgi:putative NADH-flavin reductase
MKLLVLGATGGTGIEIVKRAIERGHSVTAFVRSRLRLAALDSSIDIVEGNLLKAEELTGVISGQDAVLSAFGPRDPKSKEPLVGPFAQSLTTAMTQHGVSRLIILSVAFLFRRFGTAADVPVRATVLQTSRCGLRRHGGDRTRKPA